MDDHKATGFQEIHDQHVTERKGAARQPSANTHATSEQLEDPIHLGSSNSDFAAEESSKVESRALIHELIDDSCNDIEAYVHLGTFDTCSRTQFHGRGRQDIADTMDRLSMKVDQESEEVLHLNQNVSPMSDPDTSRLSQPSRSSLSKQHPQLPLPQDKPTSISFKGDTEFRPTTRNMTSLNHEVGNSGNMSLFESEWGKIQTLRKIVSSLRSQIQDKRALLRDKQFAKSTAEDALFKYHSKLLLVTTHDGLSNLNMSKEILVDLMKQCQNTRDEYGPIEDDCNSLEDQLSGREFDLTRLEDSFYFQLNESKQMCDLNTTVPSATNSVPPVSNLDLEYDDDTQNHPLVTKYLSRWGDLEILRERLIDFEDREDYLEEERQSRAQFGRKLSAEDQAWLDDLGDLYDGLHEQIEITEKDVDMLRQECQRQGLVDEDGEPMDFQWREQHAFPDVPDLHSDGEVSEYVRYPSLLFRSYNHANYNDIASEPDKESDEMKFKRVNEWLLERLRSSALNVYLLVTVFEKEVGSPSEDWEGAVLQVWYRDETSRSDKLFRTGSTSLRTNAHKVSYHSSYNYDSPEHLSSHGYQRLIRKSSEPIDSG